MPGYEHLSTGQRIEALSQKVSELQREVALLRHDVKRILHLLQQNGNNTGKPSERDGSEDSAIQA